MQPRSHLESPDHDLHQPRRDATQLVLGASRRSRWAELARGSVITPVVREAAGALDVHVISTEGATEGASLTFGDAS